MLLYCRLPLKSLPLAGEPEIPMDTGDNAQLKADASRLSQGRMWEKVIGGFSRPGKMPSLAWGISAVRCRVGSVLHEQDQGKAEKKTVCGNCYARKGTYAFDTVQKKLDERYQALFNPEWTPAFVAVLRTELQPGEKFR